MRAIQFKTFGDPSVLDLVEVARPVVGEKTALVRVMAASINPSDVKNVAGTMKQTTLPRSPGVILLVWSRRGRRSGSEPQFGARAAIPVSLATAPTRSLSPFQWRVCAESPITSALISGVGGSQLHHRMVRPRSGRPQGR